MMVTPESTYEDLENIRRMLGLDQPIWKQYIQYLSDIFRGDFGNSYYFDRPASLSKRSASVMSAMM